MQERSGTIEIQGTLLGARGTPSCPPPLKVVLNVVDNYSQGEYLPECFKEIHFSRFQSLWLCAGHTHLGIISHHGTV